MTYFTEEQVKLLLARIHPDRVFKRDGNSYVAGCDIRAELTRIFGFGRWSSEVLDQALLTEKQVKTKKGADAWYVLYRSRIRLTVHAPDGTLVAFHDGSHVGASTHPDFGEAHGNALTNSETYALRRAAINLGDQFGLSLYNGGSLDPLVRWTLVKPEAAAAEAAKIDTNNVPKVSAEDSDSSPAGSDEEQDAGAAFDESAPPCNEDTDASEASPAASGLQWQGLDWALEQAPSLKDEKAAGELWRESAARVHSREITPNEAKGLQDLINARVGEIRKREQVLRRLGDSQWADRIRDIADKEEARQVLADAAGDKAIAAAKGHLIREAIGALWPEAEDEQDVAA